MKLKVGLFSALAFVMLFSGTLVAQAYHGWGGGGNGFGWCGRGPGTGMYAGLTEEQAVQLHKCYAEFLSDTNELRQQLAAKQVEYTTLIHQLEPDQAKLKVVSDEIIDLRAQLAKKSNEYRTTCPGAPGFYDMGGHRGPGMGGGFHHGGWHR